MATKHGKWAQRGLTLGSFAFTDNPAADPNERRAIKTRHLHMIAAGGCVGAGMFVGSGSALAYGGPAALLIGFSVVSLMIILVVQALGELAVMYPHAGSMYVHCSRFIHPSWGFAMGWNYAFLWLIAVPLELTVCAITMSYWNFNVSMASYIAIFLAVIIIFAVFGAGGYGEEEFWSTIIKITMMLVFMIVAIICITGNGPANGRYTTYQGAKTWSDPGPFAHGFKGVCTGFAIAAFALNGTELIGLAVAETANPAKVFPRAVKQIFWRCIIFYILGLLLVGFLVPWNDARLLSTAAGHSAAIASPFVIVAADSGIRGLDSYFNAVILVAVISVGVSGIYGAGKTLAGLADDGLAPKFFGKRDVAGRPTWSTLFIICFSNIAFISTTDGGVEVFEWLVGLTGVCSLVNWMSICLAHIRFRKQWKAAGRSLDELGYQAPFGLKGSILAMIIIIAALAAQFYIAVSPVIAEPSAKGFFKAYLGGPAILAFASGNLLWRWYRKIPREQQAVIDTARADDITEIGDPEAQSTKWKRVARFLC